MFIFPNLLKAPHKDFKDRNLARETSGDKLINLLLPTVPAESASKLRLNVGIRIFNHPIHKVIHEIDKHFSPTFQEWPKGKKINVPSCRIDEC